MAAAMKHMVSNFAKLDKFEGVDFRRWQKKMHFLLSSISVVYVLTTPMPEDGGDDATMDQEEGQKDFKHTLKHKKEDLTLVELDNHLRIEESLRMQDSDKPKGNNVAGPSVVNMVEHNNSSMYNDNKGKRKHHDNTKADPNKKSKVTCWKCGKLGHLKKDCKSGKVGNKANGLGIDGSVDGSTNSLKGAIVHVCKDRCWFKTYESLNDGSILHMGNELTTLVHGRSCVDLKFSSGKIVLTESRVLVVRLSDPKLKTLDERGIKFIFVGYAEHSKAFRFFVIEPNVSVAINSITESRDAIFDENRLSSVPRPSLRIPNGTEDIGGSVVPERSLKRDEVSDQHSYCFNDEDDPNIFDEAKKSRDVAFWKEAINDVMDSIMGNNTWVLADLPPGCKTLGCKWIFKIKLKVDGTIEKFKARLVIHGFKQKSGINYFDTEGMYI
ncbi:zinc finger, CCHC-type containing protein [Tanacetum coccineum]